MLSLAPQLNHFKVDRSILFFIVYTAVAKLIWFLEERVIAVAPEADSYSYAATHEDRAKEPGRYRYCVMLMYFVLTAYYAWLCCLSCHDYDLIIIKINELSPDVEG